MRTALAVLAGFIVWPLIAVGSSQIVMAVAPGRFADDGTTRDPLVLMILLVASVVASLAAGWTSAAVAREQPMRAVWILAVINLLVGIFVQSQVWTLIPLWYHLIFLALVVPVIVMGGRLKVGSSS